ncbi:MAG: hypothetical protein EAX81_05350 [Candidatus Thorarchaeota archaeon]|nr:hypothetical protein [Candidatus Thorarchaeota archaeon]
MATDLERALSKLRFDDQVLGYSLMTKTGRPFVSFSFPDDLFPRVKDSITLYKSDLRLMTIDTEKGLVVLSPVDENWILTVLYVPELQLGLAIAKTKNVLRLLEGIELPPPPDDFEESAESNLQVLESIALEAASTASTEPVVDVTNSIENASYEPVAEVADTPAEAKTPADYNILPATIPKRGSTYSTALSLDSPLYKEMKSMYRNFGFDVLMLVDGTKSATQIADTMFQPNERVIELLKWAAGQSIVEVPEVVEVSQTADSKIGKFVKCPEFEGDISKIRGPDADIIRHCDGTKTTEEIAEAMNIPHAKVIQAIARNKKYGIKLIGKTV